MFCRKGSLCVGQSVSGAKRDETCARDHMPGKKKMQCERDSNGGDGDIDRKWR